MFAEGGKQNSAEIWFHQDEVQLFLHTVERILFWIKHSAKEHEKVPMDMTALGSWRGRKEKSKKKKQEKVRKLGVKDDRRNKCR